LIFAEKAPKFADLLLFGALTVFVCHRLAVGHFWLERNNRRHWSV